jgi:FlaA1/EpsC-like NDP-sugar epimerase
LPNRTRLDAFREWLNFRRLALDAVVILAAGVSAFLLRFEFELPAAEVNHLRAALCVWVMVKILVLRLFNLDRRAWRFFSVTDVSQLAVASVLSSVISAVILFVTLKGFPRSIPVLDLMLSFLLFGGRFLGARFAIEAQKRPAGDNVRDVLIYGAGQAGVTLLSELRRNGNLGCRVLGFVDDDPRLANLFVQGTRVLGRGQDLIHIVSRLRVTEVLVAMPSAGADEMLAILKACQRARVKCRTVPTLAEVVDGAGIAAQIRDVDVQDLLSRKPAELDHRLLREQISGRVVMVTGAAGSIGSELCRQLGRFQPAAIVAFEIAETPLFHLEREMRSSFPEVEFHGEIGSIQNYRSVCSVIARYRPRAIYHAAAYKHVPIMETSVCEAVSNNVLGTYTVARAAREHGVEEFVLISSDKAVRPTSVMGATKRLCEKVILDMPHGRTRFVAVRFGNVLGSNGSVIPVFKQQIAGGGPVTVTHPEMKRYFMTIPEASQLVLQAAAMGRGGEIFLLDMGEQIKIVDIARKLILLSGLTPDVDVKIEFTGVRPGERLYEELSLDEETTVPTANRKIKIFAGVNSPAGEMAAQTERLNMLCEEGRAGDLIELIRNLVPEYQPSAAVLSLAANRDVAGPERSKAIYSALGA